MANKHALVAHLARAYLTTNDLHSAEAVTQIMLTRKKVSVKGVRMLVLVWSAQVRQMPTSEVEGKARQQKIDQTIDILKKAELAHPEEEELYELHIGFLKEFISHYAFDALKVLDDFEANLKKSDQEAELSAKFVSMRCQFSYMSNFTKKAKEVCELAIDEDPDNHQNYLWLGRILMNTGQVKKGKRMLF